ncbi:hypothetical protein MB84_31590 (plasmid) [Pandoraea oxalativorans]|uniref:Uncharacterized protein n=1 Tax=Pandoraea oxalativorans TaxID=573737 RepID=A0A192B1X2_9BURK|nr:hypothetical protein MB84_31590 [Pandoraea oxalativorans]
MKTQGAQTLEITGELAWLSLLQRGRGKILRYSTVCHIGIPYLKTWGRLGPNVSGRRRCCGILGSLRLIGWDAGLAELDETQKDRGTR